MFNKGISKLAILLTDGVDKNTPIDQLKTKRNIHDYITSKYGKEYGIDFDYTSLEEYKRLTKGKPEGESSMMKFAKSLKND